MYLSFLKKDEKKLFLDIACYLSAVDGKLEAKEQEMLNAYCKEMNLPYDIGQQTKDPDSIIRRLKEICDEKSKKIIIFELIGLAMCDDKFDVTEKNIIINITRQMDINEKFVDECEDVVRKYLSLQNELNNLVLN